MQQHDVYLVIGVLFFFLGIIGYLSARSEGGSVIPPLLFFFAGISGVGYAYILNEGHLTMFIFMDSALRIVAQIL